MQGCWERIAGAARRNDSRLCVGLDTAEDRIPAVLRSNPDAIFEFNREVIDATIDLVCCYKPNAAFYEAAGARGLDALARTIEFVGGRVPVILDCKRGDIGNTASQYARAAFEWLGADAVTLNPYMGFDSVAPFMEYEGRGIFLLCLTSNDSSADFQLHPGDDPLYERVARKAAEWDSGRGVLGLVAGATHPERIAGLRRAAGELPFLLPGIGAQGGSLDVVNMAEIPGESLGVVVNSSRSIIYAGSGEKDFAVAVREAAEDFRKRIGGPVGAA